MAVVSTSDHICHVTSKGNNLLVFFFINYRETKNLLRLKGWDPDNRDEQHVPQWEQTETFYRCQSSSRMYIV